MYIEFNNDWFSESELVELLKNLDPTCALVHEKWDNDSDYPEHIARIVFYDRDFVLGSVEVDFDSFECLLWKLDMHLDSFFYDPYKKAPAVWFVTEHRYH